MAVPSKEAAEAWRHIESDPDFQAAPIEQKKQARSLWRQTYGLDKPGTGVKSPAQMLAEDPARRAARGGAVPQPANAPKLVPRIMPGGQPLPTKPEVYGPPSPVSNVVGNVGNALLTGIANTATYRAADAAGRPLLPPQVKQGMAPVEGVGNKIISAVPSAAETLMLSAGLTQVPGLAPFAMPLATGLTQGTRAAADVKEGKVDPAKAINDLTVDIGSSVLFPLADKALPGGTIGKTAMAEGMQSLGQALIDDQLKGQAPTVENLFTDYMMGLGTRGLSGGLRQEYRQAQQLGRDALTAIQNPIPLGDLEAQRGSISFDPKRPRHGDPDTAGGIGGSSSIPEEHATDYRLYQDNLARLASGELDERQKALTKMRMQERRRRLEAAGVLQPETRQPWEMTSAEWLNVAPSANPDSLDLDATPIGSILPPKGEPGYAIEHDRWGGTVVTYRDETGAVKGTIDVIKDENGNADILSTRVAQDSRGKGIATGLYDVARAAGIDVDRASGRGGYTEQGARLAHYRAVRDAVAAGKAVPAEVLAEYPNVTQKIGPAPTFVDRRQPPQPEATQGPSTPVRDAAGKVLGQVKDTMSQQGGDDQTKTDIPRPPAAPQADAGQAPPNQPPVAAAPAAPPPPPPRPTGTVAPGAPVPPPQPGTPAPSGKVGTDKTQAAFTPAVGRVYGEDARNLSGEAAQTVKQVADVLDDPARPLVAQEAVAAAREKVDKGDYFNWQRSGLSDETQQAMAQRIAEVVAENGWDPKQVIGFDQIKAEARAIDPEMLRHLAKHKKGETLNPAVRMAARDNLNGINAKIVELTKDLDSNGRNMTEVERQQAAEVISRLENDAKRLLDVLIPTRSQDGRNLAYHRIMAQNSFDAEYWTARARRAAGVEQLPDPVLNKIRNLTVAGQKAQAAGDEAGVQASRIAIAKELARLERSSGLQVVAAAIKAGLLTGPRTTIRNVGSNVLFGGLEELSRVPASIVDFALSGVTKRRTVGSLDVVAMGRATKDAATKGVRDALQVWRQGATDAELAKFELPREIVSGSRILDGYINGVFRFLGAQDKVAKAYAVRRSLEEQAKLIARAEAKAGKLGSLTENERRAQLVNKPTDEMSARAVGDAEEATFQNENVLSEGYQAARKVMADKGGALGDAVNLAGDVVIPFTKTPLNILARTLDYTAGVSAVYRAPVAVANRVRQGKANGESLAKSLFKQLSPEEQRGIAQVTGRGSVGAGMIYLGYKLAEKGLMSGMPEKDEQGRKGAMGVANEGIGSIKVGDRWLQLTGFAPFGSLLVTGASFYEQGNRELSNIAKKPGKLAAVAFKGIKEMPFLTGVKNVFDTLDSPDTKWGTFTAGLGRMMVPTAVGDVAGVFDDRQRAPGDFAEGVMQQIPGARNTLNERTDAFGQPKPQGSMWDPFNSKEQNNDPHIRELRRVGADVMPQRPVLNVGVELNDGTTKKVPLQLEPQEHLALQNAAGEYMKQALADMVNDPTYRDADVTDADRKKEIENLWNAAKKQARQDFMENKEALLQKRALEQIGAGGGEFYDQQAPAQESGDAAASKLF